MPCIGQDARAALEAADAGAYGVIYADPPWTYGNPTPNADPAQQYDVMDLLAICGLPVARVAAKDSVLYLWATAPLLSEGLRVLESWGFEYKTSAVWDKERLGVGYWWRTSHELLLVGTRGHVSPPPQELRVSSVIRQRRAEHSQKPDDVRRWLCDWFPDARRLEIFARTIAPGWDCIGNESAKQTLLL